ncbi:NAD(P)/FAD-dependent oxidoreductase [Actinomadura rudentiformis]|uniref:FAD-dependent oxidoreductase n=1 Tax=Actinomadura rudentiformis TaxID=359158 RepID=A0A6H9YNN7_9ACTN|nr:FAD-dependent oxidoreductase [Actinomadura rudentiformis]KAB2340562.1 FAD-dependent oxidoreductase [Actinomadura rudentiformis]
MKRTVAIVGGATVAKALESEADVILIDPRDAFVNAAASLRALTQPDWANNAFYPFETLLSQGKVIRDRAASVDAGGVTLASGEHVAADYVVLATGSSYAYPAKPASDSIDEALDDLRRTHKELRQAGKVLILGAGPVGLELAGEIKEVWPDKHVTIADPAEELLPGFKPEVVEDLRGQLDALGVEVRLGTGLVAPPATEAGLADAFTVTTTDGDEIAADIWFRAHGVSTNSDYLADGKLTTRTPEGRVPVTEFLNVKGHDHVYAVGDITDVAETKMAAFAMQHAEVVAKNIIAQLNGEPPTATYQPLPYPMIMVPLGPNGGVGQLPSPDGPFVTPAATVSEYKGADLFTGRFVEQFGPTAA